MKKYIVIAALICVVALVGCPSKKSDEAIKNITGAGNAPTLWPVYEKYVRAFIDNDWNAAWDCTSASMHKMYEDMLADAKKVNIDDLKKEKADAETELAAAPEATKSAIQTRIKHLDTQITDYDKVKGMDAHAYFVYTMETAAKETDSFQTKMVEEFTKKKVEIVKEEITGDSGKIIQKVDGKEDDVPFVKEDGKWKLGSK